MELKHYRMLNNIVCVTKCCSGVVDKKIEINNRISKCVSVVKFIFFFASSPRVPEIRPFRDYPRYPVPFIELVSTQWLNVVPVSYWGKYVFLI